MSRIRNAITAWIDARIDRFAHACADRAIPRFSTQIDEGWAELLKMLEVD